LRVAVLSDIHGNKVALDAVNEDINKTKVDKIVFLGDYITDFSGYSNEILDYVKSNGDIIIAGNREKYILNNALSNNYIQFETIYICQNEITNKNKIWINTLKENDSIKYNNNLTIFYAHGSPNSINEMINEEDESLIKYYLEIINERILVCGHTHKQWYKEINGKIILNPGSVGVNFSGNKAAQYAIIESINHEINVELKNVFYDFNELKRKYDQDISWTTLIIKGMEDGINYNDKFLGRAKEIYNEWPISNKNWTEMYNNWIKRKLKLI